jgi:hypothetical protein
MAMSGGGKFGPRAAIARLLLSLFLVFATYNPGGRSYWHWLMAGDGLDAPRLLVGLVLLSFYMSLVVATWEVIGFTGMFLGAAICLVTSLQLAHLGLIDLANESTVAMTLCVTAAAVIALGLCFSFVFSRLTGILHTRGSVH